MRANHRQARAVELARQIAAGPPLAIRYMKENINRAAEADFRTCLDWEADRLVRVAQTEDQVRVKMLEQRVATLEAQVAAMQGDRKLLDAQLVEQRLNQIEAARLGADPTPSASATPLPGPSGGVGKAPASPRPRPSPTPAARKPLVLDLR